MRASEWLNKTKFIYKSLCDEKSRQVFLSRLLWNVTDDFSFMEKIVSVDAKCIIYGAGLRGRKIAKGLIENGVSVICFWDQNQNLTGASLDGLSVKEPFSEPLSNKIIVVGTAQYSDEIYNRLLAEKVAASQIIVPDWKLVMEVLYVDAENVYFEPGIVEFADDEVFIDGGSLDFGTCKSLLKKAPDKIKKIYSFEPEPEKWPGIAIEIEKSAFKNTRLIKAGLWSKKDRLRFSSDQSGGSFINAEGEIYVDVESIDGLNIIEKISFIKMDIEGAELEALKGAQETIRRNRPKLAICVYHKPEDIIDIPLYIKSLVPEYRLYLRHYTSSESDTILYAVME